MRKFISILIAIALVFIYSPITPAAAAMTITDLQVEAQGTQSLLSWQTSDLASGCVQFGTSNNYELQSCAVTGFSISHDILLSNLLEETLYHFRLVSKAASNGEIATFDGTFKTGERADTTKPEISELSLEYVGHDNAFITWKTNEKTSGKVEFGNSSSDLNRSAGSRKSDEHEAHLRRLTPGATYYYRVMAEDEDDNKAFSSIQSFRTALNKRIDEDDLNISQVRPIAPGDGQIGETSVRVTWRNSRPADGRVSYGVDPERLNKRANADENRTFQEVTLTGLRPGTTYYYRIEQRDILRKRAYFPSEEGTLSFTTKGRQVILGASTNPGTTASPFGTGAQASILTRLNEKQQVLGTFTSIYTPASALIKTMHSTRVFSVLKGQRHWLKNPAIFDSYGYNFGDVKIISIAELEQIPMIRLAKTPDNPTVYYIYQNQGLRLAVPNAAVFNSYPANKWEDIVTLSQEDINSFPVARLVKTEDSPTIYLLENNTRRPFVSVETLERFGYNQNQVVNINKTHLQAIAEGQRIE